MSNPNSRYKLQAEQLSKLLKTNPSIVLVSHTNPDGDALGSTLALYQVLLSLGYNVTAIVPNIYPSFLEWMPSINEVVIAESKQKFTEKTIMDAELIICLDFNAFHRVERLENFLTKSKAVKVLVDHHLEPALYFDISISDVTVSSTSELVYNLIEDLGYEANIDHRVAECLYVGIMTDTGSFSYSCNHERTYIITSKLIAKGVDPQRVHNLVYDTFSENRLRLLGHLLRNKMVVLPHYKAAYISLSLLDQKKYNYQIGDSEGIVNYALSIEGIRLAAFFTEKKDKVRISFRSKGDFSVNELARTYFDGGGHKNAAGGNSYTTLLKTKRFFESLLPTLGL